MKLLCNGFNLFRQLNVNKPILEDLSKTFEFEVINQVCINQSYTILSTETGILLFYEKGIINLNTLYNKEINLIASNDDYIIFSDFTNKLFKMDYIHFNSIQDISFKDSSDSNASIVNISSGSKLIVAYLSDGSIFNVPQKLKFIQNDLADIQCGKEHCLLLDKSGNVYSFGAGSHGQLGHGKLDTELEPQLLEGLAGIKIKKIAAGGWHSCALSQDGDLYVWGWNSNGQLGLGKDDQDDNFVSVMASPQVVNLEPENLNVEFVACGSRHTICLLDNKRLYGCGWNKYHQLTRNHQENYFKLTYFHDFENEDVINLHCGPWNSAIQCK